jgi:hypothetical protein
MNQQQLKAKAEEARRMLGNSGSRRIGGDQNLLSVAAQEPAIADLFGISQEDAQAVLDARAIEVQHEAPATPERDQIIAELLAAPARIRPLQTAYDEADRAYRSRLITLTFEAFTQPLFPGKKDGDPMRIAGNEDERTAAVEKKCGQDATLIQLAFTRSTAKADLIEAQNQFDALKLAAQLIIAQ